MRIVRLAAVTLTLMAAWSSTAGAGQSPFRELGRLPSYAVTDGSRHVAWTDGKSVRVVDTTEHSSRLVPVPSECEFLTLGVGHLVFLCAVDRDPYSGCPRSKPLFYNLATGASHIPPEANGFVEQGGFRSGNSSCKWHPNTPTTDRIAELGPTWFRYTIGAFPYWDQWYLDWHRGGDPVGTTETRGSVIDLAEPDRLRRLCPPVRRKRDPSYDPDDFDDSPPHPYFDLEWIGRRTLTVDRDSELLLQRCGESQARRLARGVGYWGLRRRAIYWTKGNRVHFFALRTKRRSAYRLPLRHDRRHVIATDTRLYVTEWEALDPGIRTTFVAKIPRR